MNPSVVITTKNRKEELRTALRSVFSQTVKPEVLVLDDGSSDGTSEMVREEFPQTVLHCFNESKGLIVRRNEAARLATGEIIFSIDDDAAFSTAHVVEQTMRMFSDLRIGAIAIPYNEPHKAKQVMRQAPDNDRVWITDRFIGTAHALRRDVFLRLGGYREHLVHQGEEGDYCIRMLDAGYFVRLGSSDPIEHYESPKRDFRRMDYYGARNAILFVWQNVPCPPFAVHLPATTFNVLRWSLNPKRFLTRLKGVCIGYRDGYRLGREPVKIDIYRQWRNLQSSVVINKSLKK
jgi:glycosyltransferase involved in cell wall biosynthesis